MPKFLNSSIARPEIWTAYRNGVMMSKESSGTFLNWFPTWQSTPNKDGCIALTMDGKASVFACSDRNAYLCKKDVQPGMMKATSDMDVLKYFFLV